MTFLVPSIAEVLMNKVALRISIRVNDWTLERANTAYDQPILSDLTDIKCNF